MPEDEGSGASGAVEDHGGHGAGAGAADPSDQAGPVLRVSDLLPHGEGAVDGLHALHATGEIGGPLDDGIPPGPAPVRWRSGRRILEFENQSVRAAHGWA